MPNLVFTARLSVQKLDKWEIFAPLPYVKFVGQIALVNSVNLLLNETKFVLCLLFAYHVCFVFENTAFVISFSKF